MPRTKPTCPFTDNPCNSCRVLFVEEGREKPGKKMKGCHLAEKSPASSKS